MMTPSTQRTHVRLESIEAGVARLTDGPPHAVLAVQGVSVYLQRAEEQEGVLGAFSTLLNTLDAPLQFLVRVMPVDVEPRLSRFLDDAPAEYGEQAAAYADFLRQQSLVRDLREREYLVIVPATVPTSRLPLRHRHAAREAHEAAIRKHLTARCDVLLDALSRCGCTAHRFADDELAALYYRCWQPDTARRTRIRVTLDDWTALVVGRTRRTEGTTQ